MSQSRNYDWNLRARVAAEEACENCFESRRGVWHFEFLDVLCFYDNNPCCHRDRWIAELRRRMRQAGILELGHGTYPPAGQEDAGYTMAIILDASRDRLDFVADTMDDIIRTVSA